MRQQYEVGESVLVFDVPYNRARAEGGEELPALSGVIEADATPHGSRWDGVARVQADGSVSAGRYVDSGPEGDAVYTVRLADGATLNASVHQLLPPADHAAAIRKRAQAAEASAEAASTEAARHQAEAQRLHQAAQAIQG
jgi:hypothetical protein